MKDAAEWSRARGHASLEACLLVCASLAEGAGGLHGSSLPPLAHLKVRSAQSWSCLRLEAAVRLAGAAESPLARGLVVFVWVMRLQSLALGAWALLQSLALVADSTHGSPLGDAPASQLLAGSAPAVGCGQPL